MWDISLNDQQMVFVLNYLNCKPYILKEYSREPSPDPPKKEIFLYWGEFYSLLGFIKLKTCRNEGH